MATEKSGVGIEDNGDALVYQLSPSKCAAKKYMY